MSKLSLFFKETKIFLLFIIIIAILAFVFLGIFIGKYFLYNHQYYAVYLDTGDLYFGRLSKFPSLKLKDVWYIQNNRQKNGRLSLNQFSKVLWGPEDEMSLNNDRIVWTVKLRKDSNLIPILEGKEEVVPTGKQINPQQNQQSQQQSQQDRQNGGLLNDQ